MSTCILQNQRVFTTAYIENHNKKKFPLLACLDKSEVDRVRNVCQENLLLTLVLGNRPFALFFAQLLEINV